MKTLALACEDNASDVLLPDTEVVYLGSQVMPQEDEDVDQIGEAGQTGLSLVLTDTLAHVCTEQPHGPSVCTWSCCSPWAM